MSRERPRSTPAPMLRDETLIHKEHVTPRQGEEQWRAFFRHAFSEEQAGLLCETLFRCSNDWRQEWESCAQDAALALQDVIQDQFCVKMIADLASHHDAIIELRAQMGIVLSTKTIDSSVVEVPKFLTKSTDKQRDALVDRLADLERLAARMERQIKTLIDGQRKRALTEDAKTQGLRKRIYKLEADLKKLTTELEEDGCEFGGPSSGLAAAGQAGPR